MTIEDFNVSEECRYQLRRVGFTMVEEIAEFLDRFAKSPHEVHGAKWIRYFPEIQRELKVLDLWSEAMEQFWPSN